MITSKRISNIVLAATIAATLLTTAILTTSSTLSQSAFAQQPQLQQQPQPQPQQQQQQKAPLNFYLKLSGNASVSTSQAASQAAANGTGTKNMTITVNVQKGPGGQQIPLPISTVVPVNIQPQDLQLCASLADGSESCQPLSGGQQGGTIDLTQSSAGGGAATTAPSTSPSTGTMTPMPAPQSYHPPSSNDGGVAVVFTNTIINPLVETITSTFAVQYADAQEPIIGIEDTTVNVPITLIVPIDLNLQNAQVCASVLSSGGQSCTQAVLNPEQTSYTDVNVDLSSATPTLTTA